MIRAFFLSLCLIGGFFLPVMTQADMPDGVTSDGMIWRARVAEGLTFDDVDAAITSLAAGLNLRDVGQLPLGQQVTLMQDAPWRTLHIYMFCNPLTAASMIEHELAFSVWLPCRISLVEDAQGGLWLYTVNMDVLMDQARGMPPSLVAEAQNVRNAIYELVAGAAVGDF